MEKYEVQSFFVSNSKTAATPEHSIEMLNSSASTVKATIIVIMNGLVLERGITTRIVVESKRQEKLEASSQKS